jgi:hypothetical protein
VKKDEMGRVCSKHSGEEKSLWVLVVKLEGKRPQGRPRRGGRIIIIWILKG